jgi:hypothetical protein
MKRPKSNRPFIARDTGQPLTILGGYEIAEDGSILHNRPIDTTRPGDYGCDPLPDGMFRMVPSGDVVDAVEKNRRLRH